MTPEWEAQICADLRGGMRVIDVAEKHHIGKRRVMSIRDMNGIPHQKSHGGKGHRKIRVIDTSIPPEREAAIVKDLEAGVKLLEIMKTHHIGYDKLAEVQSKHDLFRQQKKQDANKANAIDWKIYGPKWDRVRFKVLRLLSGKEYKEEHWLWL